MRNLFQTIKDKGDVPQKVYDQIKVYAPEFQHKIFDDQECKVFLRDKFGLRVASRFDELKAGPHKADLFRYCVLYIYGGVYIDIKTVLVRPLQECFPDPQLFYTTIQDDGIGIYQGVMAAPRGHPLLLNLINHIVENDPSHYHFYTQYFFRLLQRIPRNDVVLYQELCTKGHDRYGLSCAIYNLNLEKMFTVRFDDYPWT